MPELLACRDDLTLDTLFQGQLFCAQPAQGYRFSVDAVLAAHFTAPRPGERVLDLGCGSGVIGLIVAHRYPEVKLCGLEIQADLADLARENSRHNGFIDRFQIIQGDVRVIEQLLGPESFELVLCNPPYREKASGRINAHHQAALARHEVHGEIADFVRAAAFAVKNRGKVVFVYPARRCNALLGALHAHRLTPKRLQPVYSYPEAAKACLILIEAVKNGGEQLEFLPPFYIYARKNGGLAPAMRALHEEAPCCPG